MNTVQNTIVTSSSPSMNSKSPNAKTEHERECVEVKTLLSPTDLRLTAIKKESVFCALHGLPEISVSVC